MWVMDGFVQENAVAGFLWIITVCIRVDLIQWSRDCVARYNPYYDECISLT